MIVLCGMPFEITPSAAFTAAERQALERLTARAMASEREAGRAPFRLTLVPGPPGWHDAAVVLPEGAPARVDAVDGAIRIRHRDFAAELDPLGLCGRLFRRPGPPFPLEITLRVALACRLPLEGGLPLHAAGLVIDGRGVAFFGPSGAGKSTLAERSPYPVLSDELVAVLPAEPFDVATTGFWGTLDMASAPCDRLPLGALVELGKGPRFRWERLAPRAALRRLLGVTLVPVGPFLWAEALAVLGKLARDVPVFRLEWSPEAPPWDDLTRALGGCV